MAMQKFNRLDGRHKLAILGAIVSWAVSVFFSKEGFALDAQKTAWLGWVLAGVVTVVELVFNSKTHKLSLTLIVVGILCYLYGVWTNITGFWSYQHPGIVFDAFQQKSLLSEFVGTILEVLPEPLFMWGIGAELEGDLLGNLIGLWSGDLPYAQPEKSPQAPSPYIRPPDHAPGQGKPVFKPSHKPNKKHHIFPQESLMNKEQGKNGLKSPVFNDRYVNRFKK